MRISEFLAERRVDFEPLLHAPAFTAQKLAKYLRVKGKEVAKAVLLRGPAGLFVVVLPATHQVDPLALEGHLGGRVALASEADVARTFLDCEWGVVPPFGNLYGLPTLLDESITPEMVLVLELHSHFEAIRLRCRDFERLARARRLHFARKALPNGKH